MTPSQTTAHDAAGEASCCWSRVDTAQAFADFPDRLDPAFVCFFRCPAGLAFLRRLVLALLLVFHHKNACGLRQIGHFLELVELDHFVGSSYGALHALDGQLQDDLAEFAQQQRQHLAAGMPARDIALCLDENFHGPHVCLVAIEPVSNFILVEAYAECRDSTTWAVAITCGLEGLAVRCVLFTGDQATGLIRCAKQEFQAAYHPDLFHLQRDLARPVLAPLARPIHQAEKALDKARQKTHKLDLAEQTGPLVLETTLEIVREEVKA